MVENLLANAGEAGDLGSISGWGSSPGGGNGNPFQYSSLRNPVDRGAWWATVHGVSKSRIGLSDGACTHIVWMSWGKGMVSNIQAGREEELPRCPELPCPGEDPSRLP